MQLQTPAIIAIVSKLYICLRCRKAIKSTSDLTR